MRILLTNDDGIEAPGIVALYDALQGLGDVRAVAPLSAQSAASHGRTFAEPLMVQTVVVNDRMTGVGVEGRPADCVKLALTTLLPDQLEGWVPDLTISGMNVGANVGIHILYSGTVGAAMESAFLGVPALAVSQHIGDRTKTNYRGAARIARGVIDRVLEGGLDRLDAHGVMNINVPRTEVDNPPIPPIRVVEMNSAAGTDKHERRVSPNGQAYYWACGPPMEFLHTAPDTDVEALLEGCVTVTPLTYVLTDHARLQSWKERLV